jgi:DNA-binding NtrC family response regulator
MNMKRVLVIEAEQANRKQVCQRLEADGYTALECDSGNAAIQLFRSGAHGVVLSQGVSELPPEFWQELRSIDPAPSVVVVSNCIRGELDSTTLETLRDGGFYVSLPPGEQSTPEYRLPLQGINFYDLERDVLSQALRMCHGNQTRAGTLLGLSRDQIRYRMAKFGLTSSGFQDGAKGPESSRTPADDASSSRAA